MAIWCLCELRNVAKLDQVGDTLLAAIVSLFLANNVNLSPWFLQRLTDSATELSVRWPGQRIVPYMSKLPSREYWPHVFWPKFAAAVLKDRTAIAELVMSTQWAVRRGAIEALADQWPDENTRKLLEQRAVKDENEDLRSAALQALAEKWPDENTRKLLEQRAVKDENYGPRRAALQALAEKWPDENTRTLLEQRAVKDENQYPRRGALQALAEKWPDENTRKLFEERARVDGAAASLFGKQHSEFGRVAMTRDCDGVAPYVDPRKPDLPRAYRKGCATSQCSSR